MSGHSKWSKVKHQKESTDAAKGKIFTKLANLIAIAVREGGGGDPDSNFKLRLVVEKARGFNMPKENIQRAITKALGGGEGGHIEQVIYEAFGPGGIGLIIEAATNNRQRTVAQLKNILDRTGGTLATSGAVSHLFKLVGCIEVEKGTRTQDQLMEIALNSGSEDMKDEGECILLFTQPNTLHSVKNALEKFNISIISAELIYLPITTLAVPPEMKTKIDSLMETLEDDDDVQRVFSNTSS